MPKDFLGLLRVSLGFALLCTGIVGLLLPVLQGWLLILVAIPLISPAHGKKMVAKLKEWGLKAKKEWAKRNKK